MFLLNSKSAVLYLTHNKIFYCKDSKNAPLPFDWNSKNSTEVFSAIKKQTKSSVFRIIVGNDLSYVFSMNLPSTSKLEDIISKAAESIPESVGKENISFRVSGQDKIEVFSLSGSILSNISRGASDNEVQIEYLCPIQGILANRAEKSQNTELVLFSGIEQLAVVASNGTVLGSEDIAKDPGKKMETLMKFVRDEFALEPEKTYSNFEGKTADFAENRTAQKITIDIVNIVSTHKASEDGGKDNYLTIKPLTSKVVKPQTGGFAPTGTESSEANRTNDTGGKEDKKPSVFIPIILIVVIVLALGYLGYKIMHDLSGQPKKSVSTIEERFVDFG